MSKKKQKDKQKDKPKNKKSSKTKNKKAKSPLDQISVTLDNKCDQCVQSLCCTYVTHEIDAPKSIGEFDFLYWQLSHKNIQAFKDEDGWFLSILTPCLHLLPGGACGIYDKRPKICRKHSNESCEFDGPAEEDFEVFFDSHETLDKYCRKRFKKWDTRFKKWAR